MNLSWTGSEGLVYRVHQATPIFKNVLEYETLASYSLTNVTATSTEITELMNGTNEENNGMGLCGYSDWRVPTAIELDGIVDLGAVRHRDAIEGHYFPNTKPGWFWSSSIFHNAMSDTQWAFDFNDGDDERRNRDESHLVRRIRSSFTAINSWSDSRYTDHEDGTSNG